MIAEVRVELAHGERVVVVPGAFDGGRHGEEHERDRSHGDQCMCVNQTLSSAVAGCLRNPLPFLIGCAGYWPFCSCCCQCAG